VQRPHLFLQFALGLLQDGKDPRREKGPAPHRIRRWCRDANRFVAAGLLQRGFRGLFRKVGSWLLSPTVRAHSVKALCKPAFLFKDFSLCRNLAVEKVASQV
jgi:hypothetical protein